MDFNMSDRQKEWLERVQAFMKTHVRPAVPIYDNRPASPENSSRCLLPPQPKPHCQSDKKCPER